MRSVCRVLSTTCNKHDELLPSRFMICCLRAFAVTFSICWIRQKRTTSLQSSTYWMPIKLSTMEILDQILVSPFFPCLGGTSRTLCGIRTHATGSVCPCADSAPEWRRSEGSLNDLWLIRLLHSVSKSGAKLQSSGDIFFLHAIASNTDQVELCHVLHQREQ